MHVLSLFAEDYNKDFLRLFDPYRIIFIVSDEICYFYSAIKQTVEFSLSCKEVCLYSISPPTDPGALDADPVQVLKDFLPQLIYAQFYYLPIHTIRLAPQSPIHSNACDVFSMISHNSRKVFPLMLSKMGVWNGDKYANVRDLTANDILPCHRSSLRSLAREIAAMIVFEFGLDPSKSIFTLGATSSLIGQTLQSEISELVKTRVAAAALPQDVPLPASVAASLSLFSTSANNNVSREDKLCQGFSIMRSVYSASNTTNDQNADNFGIFKPETRLNKTGFLPSTNAKISVTKKLDTAVSFLLIDRTEDVVTPASHASANSPAISLAHRILATIPRGVLRDPLPSNKCVRAL